MCSLLALIFKVYIKTRKGRVSDPAVNSRVQRALRSAEGRSAGKAGTTKLPFFKLPRMYKVNSASLSAFRG